MSILEAMACRLPAIATPWISQTVMTGFVFIASALMGCAVAGKIASIPVVAIDNFALSRH
jgi:hypothetical protein